MTSTSQHCLPLLSGSTSLKAGTGRQTTGSPSPQEPGTDWFIDPQGASSANNAPALLFASRAPGLLSAVLTVDFGAKFDAGALALYQHAHAWAKLCLEYSPQRQPTLVSVVTREASDDCNAFEVKGRSAHLRVARLERAFAFHYSPDGSRGVCFDTFFWRKVMKCKWDSWRSRQWEVVAK